MRSSPCLLIPLIAGCLSLVVGCGGVYQSPAEDEPLSVVLSAYMDATHALERAPQNEAELKKFLPEGEQALISPNDGQPFAIRWNVAVHDENLDPANPPVIAYERQGKNGVHQAVTVMGLTELTDAQVAELAPP